MRPKVKIVHKAESSGVYIDGRLAFEKSIVSIGDVLSALEITWDASFYLAHDGYLPEELDDLLPSYKA